MECVVLGGWLLLPGTVSIIRAADAAVVHAFSFLCDILLCDATTGRLPIPLLMDIGEFPVWGSCAELCCER